MLELDPQCKAYSLGGY